MEQTFMKGDRTRVATSPTQAVQLKWNGWKRVEDAPPTAPPPLTGRGSGREAWAAWASANGVDVNDDASRDNIVEALKTAGIPTTAEAAAE